MIYHGDALQYIYDTPEIVKNILEKQGEILKPCLEILGKEIPGEILLTGSGSSYNAAVAASAFAKRVMGIRVAPVYPVALIEKNERIPERALVIGISQQGTSTAVIKALDMAKKQGAMTLAVTGEYNTEIVRHGDACLYIECGLEDAGATTKGYTATLATLMLFLIMYARHTRQITAQQETDFRDRLQAVAGNMKNVLEQSEQWCLQTAHKLKNTRDLMIISTGGLKAGLLESCLKFSETCRFPVRGYEAEEFMHGIYNAVTKETEFLYLFPSGGYEVKRMEQLFGYYEQKGNIQYAINYAGFRKENSIKENLLECGFINDPEFSVLEYILPQQMLFVLTSRARGIDLNIPKDPDFHKYMGSKEENIEKGE